MLLFGFSDTPKELAEKRPKVVAEFERLQKRMKPLQDIFSKEEVSEQLQSSRDTKQLVDFLVEKHGLKMDMIDTCYTFAKFCYEICQYPVSIYLFIFNTLNVLSLM